MENTFWKIEEASQFLRTSKCNLYKLTMNSKIPHYKFGRSLRFKKEELIKCAIEDFKILPSQSSFLKKLSVVELSNVIDNIEKDTVKELITKQVDSKLDLKENDEKVNFKDLFLKQIKGIK